MRTWALDVRRVSPTTRCPSSSQTHAWPSCSMVSRAKQPLDVGEPSALLSPSAYTARRNRHVVPTWITQTPRCR